MNLLLATVVILPLGQNSLKFAGYARRADCNKLFTHPAHHHHVECHVYRKSYYSPQSRLLSVRMKRVKRLLTIRPHHNHLNHLTFLFLRLRLVPDVRSITYGDRGRLIANGLGDRPLAAEEVVRNNTRLARIFNRG